MVQRRIVTNREILTFAINDGINRFVREGLIASGLVDTDAYDANRELDELRRRVTHEVAEKWEVSWFDDEA